MKDMIKTGGENVASVKVEEVLLRHPAVANAAVVGVPHPQWGEGIAAFVVLKPGAECDGAALQRHCRHHLAGFEVPKRVGLIEKMPTTSTGKIQSTCCAANTRSCSPSCPIVRSRLKWGGRGCSASRSSSGQTAKPLHHLAKFATVQTHRCLAPSMKTPKRIQPLVDEGLVDEVTRQLMSGKEAIVYVVRCGDDVRCAKVYKEANQRSFHQAVAYQEGRRVKNSRQARAMEKGTRYGRKMAEEVWQNAEVDALYRLAAAGVRVPTPYVCFEGVLLMELVTDADGNAAPRLNDVPLTAERAREFHAAILRQVVLMLCAGVIHGDLSEYNILVDADGPVIIDLPQAIDAAGSSVAARPCWSATSAIWQISSARTHPSCLAASTAKRYGPCTRLAC